MAVTMFSPAAAGSVSASLHPPAANVNGTLYVPAADGSISAANADVAALRKLGFTTVRQQPGSVEEAADANRLVGR